MSVRPGELVISDSNYNQVLEPVIDGEKRMRGLVPRDWNKHPFGSLRGVPGFDPNEIKIIPRNEWQSRIKDKEQAKSQLSDFRLTGNKGQAVPSLDQNGSNYCWAHSSVQCVTVNRIVANEPYVPLSAYSVACKIKNYANEGGWGALSLDFIREKGVAPQSKWPQGSFQQSNDNEQTWQEAAKYKSTESWIDLDTRVYDRNLTFDQVATLLLLNIPVVLDYNWWSHSVLGLDLVYTNDYGIRIWNSWGDKWSDRGMGILEAKKSIPDGAVASRVMKAG